MGPTRRTHMLRRSRLIPDHFRASLALAVLVSAFATRPALAHSGSRSHLDVEIAGRRLLVKLELRADMLAEVLSLKLAPDNSVADAEVAGARDRIAAYVKPRLTVQLRDGTRSAPCPARLLE